MKSDAIAVAKRAELQTVDANQTVFREGFPFLFLHVCFYVIPLTLHLLSFRNVNSCARILVGEVGSEFYFVLQGSVAIKVGTKIVKVRCS